MSNFQEKATRAQAFVTNIIERMQNDKRMTAILKRADNAATEYQSWEYLAAFNVNLENDNERLPFATIVAALARSKVTCDGNLGIGKAIAQSYPDGNQSDQAKAKLRRLLACDTTMEVCRILRQILRLAQSRNVANLNFAQLLNDLCWFCRDDKCQQIKARWAQDFYYRNPDEITEEANA